MSKTLKILVGIVVIILIGLGIFSLAQTKTRLTGDTIKIGWIGPLTGSSAILGMDSVKAAKIAVDNINAKGGIQGKKVSLLIQDDQYQTSRSIAAYDKLVHTDSVKIIMMQTYSGVFALAEQAKKDRVAIIDVLDSNDNLAKLGSNVFSVGVESESISRLLSGYANRQGYKTVGIIYFNSDTFMPYVKNQFVSNFSGRSIAEGYQAGEKEFKTILTKLKAEQVDALVCLGYDECGIAIKQARLLGINSPLLMPGTITSPALQELAEGKTEGSIFTFWTADKDTDPAKTFREQFTQLEGREPYVDLFTYPAYDAVTAIATALEKSSLSIDSFGQALREVNNIKGVTGEINFAEDGTMRIPFRLFSMTDGKPTPLK